MDQFGFYRVGDARFYSVLEAFLEHARVGKPLKWDFNESVFSVYDWKTEPAETLEELYRQRAQQIRDRYDHVVLWFSGGSDSTNVLNSFVDNDIKLDEVASQVNYEATHSRFDWLNGEIYNVAIPKWLKAKQKQPWLQHTVIDIAQQTMDHFSHAGTKFDWMYHMNWHFNPNNASKKDIKLSQPHWRDMIEAGKRVAFVHGMDKPYVIQVKNRYYFRFRHMVDTAVSGYTQMLNRPWEFDELFYWTPDLPELTIKQAHVVKRYLKQIQPNDPFVSLTKRTSSGEACTCSKKINDQDIYITPNGISKLIYPGWAPALYQFKAPNLIFTPRDAWFFRLPDSDPAKYSWRIGLEHLWQTTPDLWKNNPADITAGFKDMYSKHYDIGF